MLVSYREERLAEHPHEYYLDLINSAIKVRKSEWSPEEKRGHEQFGNNFYLLFTSRLSVERATDPEAFRTEMTNKHWIPICCFLNKVESEYPQQWANFLNQNVELLRKIDDALDLVFNYKRVLEYHDDMFFTDEDKYKEKLKELKNLEFDSMGIYAWRQLNPLLEESAKKMKKLGIKVKGFLT